LQGEHLRIDPCVPRWWRDFEITYRRDRTIYRIKVENPLGISRGITTVELDGALQPNDEIPLSDDGKTHNVRVVMGEKAKSESDDETTAATQQQPASNG
jgi:cyclic beta-1,2-glucan synthetase